MATSGTLDAHSTLAELRADLHAIRTLSGLWGTYLTASLATRLNCNHSLARLRIRLYRARFISEPWLTPRGDQETAPILEIIELIDITTIQIQGIDRYRRLAGDCYLSLKMDEPRALEEIETVQNVIEAQEVAAYENGGIFTICR